MTMLTTKKKIYLRPETEIELVQQEYAVLQESSESKEGIESSRQDYKYDQNTEESDELWD